MLSGFSRPLRQEDPLFRLVLRMLQVPLLDSGIRLTQEPLRVVQGAPVLTGKTNMAEVADPELDALLQCTNLLLKSRFLLHARKRVELRSAGGRQHFRLGRGGISGFAPVNLSRWSQFGLLQHCRASFLRL